jgi:hypothetical protein
MARAQGTTGAGRARVVYNRRMSVLSARALAASLLLLPACKPKDGAVAPDAAAADAAGQAAVAAAPVSAVARPAQMLPQGTGMLVVGASASRVATVLGRDRLVEAFGPQYELMRAGLAPAFGFDPLDPSAYASVGLDAEAPVGFAVLDLSQQVVAIFCTVADAAKFEASVRSVAGKRSVTLGEREYPGASVLRPEGDPSAPAVVMRGSMAVLVLPMGTAPSVDWAERLATVAPEDSLSRARGYRRAMGSYPDGDVLAFIDAALLTEQAIARTQAMQSAEPPDVEAPPAGGESDAGAQATGAESWKQRDAAAEQLLSLTMSGIEGLGVRLTAKKSGLFVEGRAALSPEAFLRRALHNVQGRMRLPNSMSGEPLLHFGAGLDPAAAQEWLDLAMQADGTSWAQVAAELKDESGIDLDRDLVPLLQGDAAFMVTLDQPLSDKPSLPGALGLAIHARVGDPAAAKAFLQKLDASTGKIGAMLEPDGDRFVADVPGWRKVWVEVAGDHLVVATDGQLGIRMARDSRGMMGRSTNPPEAWAAMMMPDRAAVFALDARFLALTMMGVPSVQPGPIEAGDFSDVPMSRKAKAKQKEIDALDEKLEKAQTEMIGKELERFDGIVTPLGTTVITAAIDDRGIDLLGAQLIRGESLPAVIESFARSIASVGTSASSSDELFRLMDQRAKLEAELRTIREADAARIKGRKPRGGKAAADPKKLETVPGKKPPAAKAGSGG